MISVKIIIGTYVHLTSKFSKGVDLNSVGCFIFLCFVCPLKYSSIITRGSLSEASCRKDVFVIGKQKLHRMVLLCCLISRPIMTSHESKRWCRLSLNFWQLGELRIVLPTVKVIKIVVHCILLAPYVEGRWYEMYSIVDQ